jgi:hypothetical protein
LPIIENGKAVLVDLDGKLKLVPAEQAEAAASQMGWTDATPDQIAADDARKAELQKPVVEQVVGAGLAGVASIGGAIGAAIPEALGGMSPEEEQQAGEFLRSPLVTGQRAASPTAFSLGQSVPAVAAGALLPGAGAAGLAATIGVDAASGYGQAAVDAELENRGISGADVLRNAGMNLAFSLPLFGLGAAAKAVLGKPKNVLESAADAARDTAGRRAAAAEGQELANAVADPQVQADLLDRVALNTEDAVSRAHDRIGGLAPPGVARNPNAQKQAVGAIADVVRTGDPELAARLDSLLSGSSKKRLEGLREIRDELAAAGESDTLTAIDATVGREDLWGSRAVRGSSDVDAVLGARPGPGATPEELIDYSSKLRTIRDGEFAGMADEIEQLAERQIEIRTASTIGDVATEAADDVVDYAKAMRTMDPSEAWRLTRDGADEGLRKLESSSVSDAMQRVDDVLKEDVAMSVKRQDFVKGAETWTPAQVAKQDTWAETMRGRAMALAGELDTADSRGFRIGGFRAEARDLIDRTVQRIADADPITANHEWDSLKRSLDSIAKRLASTGPAIDDASKAWGTKRILELNDDLRKGLEDSELWGRNANLQKETNAAWVNIIEPYSRVTKKMAEFLGREFGVVGSAGLKRRFDPDMIESIMKGGYQKNLRADVDASIKGLDQMMKARQAQGLSRLDRLATARADLVRIRQGFDMADMLAVAKTKAKAPIGLEIAQRFAGTQAPSGIIGSVVGPLATRAGNALVGDMPMLAPGSKSAMAGVLRRHIGLTRGEQAAMLADPAFFERLPPTLQKQVMAGSAAGDRAVELAQVAAAAAQRDREITARLMVNPADAKRAKKTLRSTPAIDRALKRAGQRGMVDLRGGPKLPPNPVKATMVKGGGKYTAEAQNAAAEAIAGKSIKDLGAVSDNLRSENLDFLRNDPHFKAYGTVSDKMGRTAGGLPRITIGADGAPKLSNGRHRLTVARELGLSQIEGIIQRQGPRGGVLWEYRGPISVGSNATGAAPPVPLGGESGMVDLAGGIAKSPLGVGTGAAGAVVAYHEAAKPADPETQTPLQRFSDGYDRPSDAFRAARKMVLSWQQDPGALVDMIDGHIGDVGTQSPKLAREMTAQAMRIAGYLQDNLPGQRNVSVVYPDGSSPSRAEVRQFALRFGAAIDPAGVMADARMGRIERVQLDTLAALWPQEYDALRVGVLQELGKGQATPRVRQRMSLLFSFPSGVDPALGPRTRAIVAAARAAQDEQAPAPSSPGMNRQRMPSTATMQPAGMAALSLGQQIQP